MKKVHNQYFCKYSILYLVCLNQNYIQHKIVESEIRWKYYKMTKNDLVDVVQIERLKNDKR